MEFDKLYQYIKKEIFEYDNTQKLPKYMILRLVGLHKGQFMANNNVKAEASYEYSHILYAFKINQMQIKKAIRTMEFKNEQHKFNTIMLIVERDLNNVVNRLKQAKKDKEKIENMPLENIIHEGAEYKRKSTDKEILEDLW